MTTSSRRLGALDALRGLASAWVACAHIYSTGTALPVFQAALPLAVTAFFTNGGHLGVMIFFVLSGFVIAHSTYDATPSGRFALEFTARRSLRLDPPYWLALVLLVALHALSNAILTDRTAPLPSAPVFLANMFYLQVIPGIPGILGVAWTLCLEVQFYLLFILSLWLASTVAGPAVRRAHLVILLPLSVWSLLSLFGITSPIATVQYWFAFFGGVLGCWSTRRAVSLAWPLACAAIVAVAAGRGGSAEQAIAALTIALLAVGGRRGWLTLSGGKMLQALGACSYSLYLVHTIVSGPIQNVGHRLTGESVAFTMLWALAGLAASLVVAVLMRRYVEVQSIRLASRLKGWHQRDRAPYVAAGFSRPTVVRLKSDATYEDAT